MRIILADDEKNALRAMYYAVLEACPDADIYPFRKGSDVIAFSKDLKVDVAFLDIKLPGYTGMELARAIKETNPKANIIFCTAFAEYAMEAISLHASGYILKPVDADTIREQMENLLYPVESTGAPELPIRISCFGNFEVFYQGRPLNFKREKTRELFAYLVDRKGALCSNAEISAVIWDDDRNHSSLFQDLQSDLKNTFRSLGCENVITSTRGKLGVCRDQVRCDYYDFLDGRIGLAWNYQGEYMQQYSWSEQTNGWLSLLEDRMEEDE